MSVYTNGGNRAVDRDADLYGSDAFADLEWERDIMDGSRHAGARRKRQINLTSQIEEYMRSMW